MVGASQYAKAHQNIGAYFCEFSNLERELGEALKVILRIDNHEAGDAIVAALKDVARKIELVEAAVLLAKHQDGSDASQEWKDSANKTISAMWKCKDDRIVLAHAHLEPDEDGGVSISRLKIDDGKVRGSPYKWTDEDFGRKVDGLKALKQQLAQLRGELSKLKVPYRELEWLSDTGQIFQPRRMSGNLWDALSAAPGSPKDANPGLPEVITEVAQKLRGNP